MRHQVSEKIGPFVNDAIEKHRGGEKILWEPGLMPGPNGEALVICFFWMPGAVLGTIAQGSFAIHDPLNFTAKDADEVVAQFFREMRAARSGQLAEAGTPIPPQGPAPIQRGQQRPSGLFVV